MNGFNPAVLARRAVVVVLLGGATAAQAADGILLFETFDTEPSGWIGNDINSFGGWRATDGNPGGCFILNQGGWPQVDPSVSRIVAGLTPGRRYRLQGDFKDYYNYCPQPTQTSFRVDLNGATVFASARVLEWTQFRYEWTAESAQVTVLIRAETDGTDCDAVIDNIRLQEVPPCRGDITGNQVVDAVDLSSVLSAWGTNGQGQFMADVTGDDIVDGEDLAFVLSGWGPCP